MEYVNALMNVFISGNVSRPNKMRTYKNKKKIEFKSESLLKMVFEYEYELNVKKIEFLRKTDT